MHSMIQILRFIIFAFLISNIVTKPENLSIRRENVQVSTSGNNTHKTVKSDKEISKALEETLISIDVIILVLILGVCVLMIALVWICPWKYITCQCQRGWVGRNWLRFRNWLCFNNCCCQWYRNFCNVNPDSQPETADPQVVYDGHNVSIE